MIWILIGFLICMVAGCYVAYKEAKIHELHKMRAAFEDKKHSIENLMDTLEVKEDEEAERIFEGEILGFEKAVELLREEGADEDLIDEIKKDIDTLKGKIKGLYR